MNLVEKCFKELRNTISKASKCKQPISTTDLATFLSPLSETMRQVNSYKETKRGSNEWNHLMAVTNGITTLGWVASQAPINHIKDTQGGIAFYTNKILLKWRNDPNGKTHVSWVKKFNEMITEMSNYVKEYHFTGLRFNPNGVEFQKLKDDEGTKKTESKKVEEVKKEEKPVKEQKPEVKPKVVKTTAKKSRITGKPRCELERAFGGAKWMVENYDGKKDLIIEVESIKHSVYIIKCDNCIIQIKGKCASIIMGMIILSLFIFYIENCQKTNVVFENAVASAEIVNCKSCKMQVTGVVPTVNIDKTDGATLFLSKESIQCEIISSKSSEMNVCVPHEDSYKEIPIPQQFTSKYDTLKNQLITTHSNLFV